MAEISYLDPQVAEERRRQGHIEHGKLGWITRKEVPPGVVYHCWHCGGEMAVWAGTAHQNFAQDTFLVFHGCCRKSPPQTH